MPSRNKQLSVLRLWLMVSALLFSQWVFSNHDHVTEHTADETCQVCLLTDHFDVYSVSEFTLPPSLCLSAGKVELDSVVSSADFSSNTPRAPPPILHY